MSKQARKVKNEAVQNEAIAQWNEGPYSSKGLFSEVLPAKLRCYYEVLETLKEEVEKQNWPGTSP